MSSYEIIFHATYSHGGSVVYGSWVNAMSEFTSDLGTMQDGDELRVGSGSPGLVFLPPALYKLGTLTVTMQACSFLTFATSNGNHPEWYTGFYSECPGGGGRVAGRAAPGGLRAPPALRVAPRATAPAARAARARAPTRRR